MIPQHHKQRVEKMKERQAANTLKERFSDGKGMRPRKLLAILLGIFVLSLFIRVYFSIQIGTQDDGFRMTGGSDPYYHKHVVDYVLEEHEHLEFDEMLNYPLGGENPRPPLFDWIMAVTGIIFAPLFGGDYVTSAWWAVQILPALFGALTIFPVYLIAKDALGEKYALFGAFLYGMMPGAISHSTLGLADHDSYFLFFVVTAIYFYQRSLGFMSDQKYIQDWTSMRDIKQGINEFMARNSVSMGYAMMSGFAILAVALAWKGFPYVMVILFSYFLFQSLLSRFKNQDSMGLSVVTLIALGIPLLFSAPYYFTVVSPTWWISPFYIFFATAIISYMFVPTRDLPWLAVMTIFLSLILSAVLLVFFVFTGFSESVSGTGYFLRTKLFDTISEAQSPDLSNIVYAFGPTLFFAAFFLGIPYLFYLAFKKDSKNLFLLAIWSVISVYMASTAARFLFNATPIIAILGAWSVYLIVEWAGFSPAWAGLKKGVSPGWLGLPYRGLFSSIWKNIQIRHYIVAIFVAFLIVTPAIKGGIDAGIPFEEKKEWDERWYNTMDSNPATRALSVPDDEDYNVSAYNELWYLGATGPSYPSDYWLSFFDWLATQDQGIPEEERPAFISWWDYGFWSINLGEHPTVADNFQNGYETTGSFITSSGEADGIAIFIHRTLESELSSGIPDPIQDLLREHLSNETVEKMDDVYDNPQDYIIKDVSESNSVLRTIRDLLLDELDVGELADLYHELQKETDTSIRYFAVDSRMFPFEATNNIFYAPTVLSDQTTDTFYEILYVEGDEAGNPTGRTYTSDDLEAMDTAQLSSLRIVDQDIQYLPAFYETMFYKAYIGYSGTDIGAGVNDGIPGVKGDLGNLQPLPGWMMQHFKLVYKTTYWNPYEDDAVDKHPEAWKPLSLDEAGLLYDEEGGSISAGLRSGVSAIKYYDGAILEGVVRTEEGTVVPNARVTVIDDMATPHDSMITDETGEYRLILPFGNVTIVATYGELMDEQDMVLQATRDVINSTTMHISDDQAMRRFNWELERDLIVQPGSLSGGVYFDKNNDNDFSETQDEVISKGFLNLSNLYSEENYYHAELDMEGGYLFEDLPPGEYALSYNWLNYSKEIDVFAGDNIFLPANEDNGYTLGKSRDINFEQAKFKGNLLYANGSKAVGVDLVLRDRNNTVYYYNTSDGDGKFEFDELFSSRYQLSLNDSDAVVLPSFRPESYEEMYIMDLSNNYNYFTLSEGNTTDWNETVFDVVHVSGRTLYDRAVRGEQEVEFYEPSLNLRFTAESDENGSYEMALPHGSYRVVSTQLRSVLKSSFYDTFEVDNTISGVYDVDQQMSYKVKGYLFWDNDGDNKYDQTEGLAREVFLVVKENYDESKIYSSETSLLPVATDGLGAYEVYLPEGNYKFVYTDKDTGRSATEEFTVKAMEPKDFMWLNVSLSQGTTVSGKVEQDGWLGNGNDDSAVTGALIRFEDEEGNQFLSYSDVEGYYDISLPEQTTYLVTVEAFGLWTHSEFLVVDRALTHHFELQPEESFVTGTVTYYDETLDKELPAAGCSLTFKDQVDTIYFTITEADGSYAVELPPQEYDVMVKRETEDYVFARSDFITVNFGEGEQTLDYTLYKYVVLTGTVLNDGDEANVTIEFRDSGIPGQDGEEFTLIEEAPNGVFELDLLPGVYTMIITLPNDDQFVRRIEVTQTMNLGAFDLFEEYSGVKGYIYDDKDENGEQESDETVGVTIVEFKDLLHGSYFLETSSSARYDFFLYETDYEVIVQLEGYFNFSQELSLNKYLSDFDLKLIPRIPLLSGYIWYDTNDNGGFDDNEGVRYITVEIEARTDGKITQLTTDTGGYYELRVRPGDYDVEARYYDEDDQVRYTRKETREEVEPGKNLMLNLSLEKQYRIEGFALDGGSKQPLSGIEVQLLSSSGSQQEETLSTEDGHYQLYERAGDYFLYAQGNNEHGDSFSTIQAVDLQDDEARTVDLELFKAADMEVVVFNDSYQSTIDIGSVKVEALDHGGLDFSKSTSEEGSFSIVLPAGNYRFTGSDQQTVDERKVEYKLDDTILIGNISQDMILYVEAEKNQRFGIMVDFPEPSSHNVYRDAEKEFEVLVTNIGNETQSVELSVNFDGLLSNYANVSLSEEVFDLRAGDNKTITVTVSLDDSAPLNYRDEIVVTSIVDEDSAIEVEDSLYVVVKRSRLSDIRVKEMTIEDRPRLKENYLIEVVIENLNPYSVAENFNVEFRVAGEVVATEENVTIPSGSNTTTVSIEVEAGKTGDALVRVILDSADTVDETNEENNEATQNINIWPTERVEDIDEGVPMYQRVIMIVVAAICLAIVTVTFINRKKK